MRPLLAAALGAVACEAVDVESIEEDPEPIVPEVELVQPRVSSAFAEGDRIEFVFAVDDGPDGLYDLAITWHLTGLAGQPSWSDLWIFEPDEDQVRATWRRADPGDWEVRVVAVDPAGNRDEDSVVVSVGDLFGLRGVEP